MSEDDRAFYTYMIECEDGSLYTGWSTDPEKRFASHLAGKGARYTRARKPVRLVKTWAFETQSEAMRFEIQLKKLPRPEKLRHAGLLP